MSHRLLVVTGLLLLLALGIFGQRVHWVEEAGTAERDGYVAKAEELLAGRVPEDPYRPLLYPLLTAALARVGLTPFTAARLLSNLAAVALVLLAWGFGRKLGGSEEAGSRSLGFWAAAATAVNPNVWILGQHVTTDMLFAALAAGSWLAALAWAERPRRSTALLTGLHFGAAAFTRGNALFLLPGLLAAVWLGLARSRKDSSSGAWRPWGTDLLVAFGGAVLVLLPHWILRAVVFGSPFHDQNWKNLAWKLHGYPDWSYLDRVPFGGLWEVVASSPGALLGGGFAELTRFLFEGGISQLLGTPLHALLFVGGSLVALWARPKVAGWLLFAGGCFLVALAFAFFTWGRLLLVLLPAANALAFAALAGKPGQKLRTWITESLPAGSRSLGESRWLPHLARVAAAGLIAVLAVKTFVFRLPDFIDRHPYREVEILRQLDQGLPAGAALAGTSPFLGRYLDHPYLALPDAFGDEIEDPELWFAKVRPFLAEAGVRYLVIGAKDLRDRPASLLGASAPAPWLEGVQREPTSEQPEVRVWQVRLRVAARITATR